MGSKFCFSWTVFDVYFGKLPAYVIIEMDSSLTGDVANHRSMGMDAVRARWRETK
jgi:hypothetical protein